MHADPTPLDIAALRLVWLNTLADETYPDNDDEVVLLKAIPALLSRLEVAESALATAQRERDELLSAEHASALIAERDTYKAGYEAKTTLIHELVATLSTTITHNKEMQTALAQALEESGHTKFCRAYQDIGDCDCWFGEAWAAAHAPEREGETNV